MKYAFALILAFVATPAFAIDNCTTAVMTQKPIAELSNCTVDPTIGARVVTTTSHKADKVAAMPELPQPLISPPKTEIASK